MPKSGEYRIYKDIRVYRDLRKKGTTETGGFVMVADGQEEVIFDIILDWDMVRAMGRKAASNKSGKSKDGPVTAVVTKRRRVS